ncbi:hypothetical protein ACRS6B_28165 [Nocardia asteroides]
MSSAGEVNRRELKTVEAELQRLDEVRKLLGDIRDVANAVEHAKGFEGCDFESSRSRYAIRTSDQLWAERREVFDRMLIARHGEERAAQIKADANELVVERLRQERRSRDVRRSR